MVSTQKLLTHFYCRKNNMLHIIDQNKVSRVLLRIVDLSLEVTFTVPLKGMFTFFKMIRIKYLCFFGKHKDNGAFTFVNMITTYQIHLNLFYGLTKRNAKHPMHKKM